MTIVDTEHCESVSLNIYEIIFEVVLYDADNHLVLLVILTSWQWRRTKHRKFFFQACPDINGLYVPNLSTILYQEKSIYSSFSGVFTLSKLFLDALLIKKNISKQLGSEPNTFISIY